MKKIFKKALLWLLPFVANFVQKEIDEHGVSVPFNKGKFKLFVFTPVWVEWYNTVGRTAYNQWYSNFYLKNRQTINSQIDAKAINDFVGKETGKIKSYFKQRAERHAIERKNKGV